MTWTLWWSCISQVEPLFARQLLYYAQQTSSHYYRSYELPGVTDHINASEDYQRAITHHHASSLQEWPESGFQSVTEPKHFTQQDQYGQCSMKTKWTFSLRGSDPLKLSEGLWVFESENEIGKNVLFFSSKSSTFRDQCNFLQKQKKLTAQVIVLRRPFQQGYFTTGKHIL